MGYHGEAAVTDRNKLVAWLNDQDDQHQHPTGSEEITRGTKQHTVCLRMNTFSTADDHWEVL